MDASDYCKFDIDITLRQLQAASGPVSSHKLLDNKSRELKEMHKSCMRVTEVDTQEFFNGEIEHFKPVSTALLKKESDTDE